MNVILLKKFSSQEETVKVVAEAIKKNTKYQEVDNNLCIYRHLYDIYYNNKECFLIPEKEIRNSKSLNLLISNQAQLMKKNSLYPDIVDMSVVFNDVIETMDDSVRNLEFYKKFYILFNLMEISLDCICIGEQYDN